MRRSGAPKPSNQQNNDGWSNFVNNDEDDGNGNGPDATNQHILLQPAISDDARYSSDEDDVTMETPLTGSSAGSNNVGEWNGETLQASAAGRDLRGSSNGDIPQASNPEPEVFPGGAPNGDMAGDIRHGGANREHLFETLSAGSSGSAPSMFLGVSPKDVIVTLRQPGASTSDVATSAAAIGSKPNNSNGSRSVGDNNNNTNGRKRGVAGLLCPTTRKRLVLLLVVLLVIAVAVAVAVALAVVVFGDGEPEDQHALDKNGTDRFSPLKGGNKHEPWALPTKAPLPPPPPPTRSAATATVTTTVRAETDVRADATVPTVAAEPVTASRWRPELTASITARPTTWTTTTRTMSTTGTEPATMAPTATPLVEADAPASNCSSNQFTCANGECIHLQFACDGMPDCSDGSDESVGCSCSPDQFRCANGQCIPRDKACNYYPECEDSSDEANCPGCPFECKSNNVCLWDGLYSRCNGFFNCDDMSDEMDCPQKPGLKPCSNGVMLEVELFCDGLDDCGDNSDEENCEECREPDQFLCSEEGGQCIPATWACDGQPDCANGRDEEGCDNCTAGQFACKDFSCIYASLRCDGKVDCHRHGGDEDDCLSLSPEGHLLVRVTRTAATAVAVDTADLQAVPVCAEGWSDGLANQACSLLGAGSLHSWKLAVIDKKARSAVAVVDRPDLSAPLLSNLKHATTCPGDTVVQLSCNRPESPQCGERKVPVLGSLIARGGIASPGKWPWVVSLAYLGKPICGGTVIDQKWVLTAAHCIMSASHGSYEFSKVPFYFTVTAGATDLSTANSSPTNTLAHQPKPQILRVAEIIFHPDREVTRSGGVNWDLALLKLEAGGGEGRDKEGGGGLAFSELVQPICLSKPGENFWHSSFCHVAGWGLLSDRQAKRVQQLRDARMAVWPESRCRTATVYGETEVDTNSTLCGGFLFKPTPMACKGDSGGPLMCRDPASGRYELAGIVSRGGEPCGMSRSAVGSNRFARVATATDWIQRVMGKS